jgi:TolB-like protein
MFKKTVALFFCFILGGIAYSQQITLSKAIQDSVQKIESELKTGQKVAVFDFVSESHDLSEHIIKEINDIIVNGKKLVLLERDRFDEILKKERDFQLSEVQDYREKVSIARIMGAQYVITGSLKLVGSSYIFDLYAIDIERGARVSSSRFKIRRNDNDIASFLGSPQSPNINRNRNNIDDWRNKQAYIGGYAGYGDWYNGYDFTDIGVYRGGVIGFKAEVSAAQFFSIDFDVGLEIGNTGLGFVTPCADILAHIPFRFEFGLDIGILGGIYGGDPYYFGVCGGASLGYKVGNGILFLDGIYMKDVIAQSNFYRDDYEETTGGFILRLGYKAGVGKRNK